MILAESSADEINRPVDEDAVTPAVPNARICVAEIGRLLDGHTWLPGDAISLADLLLAPHLSMSARALEGAEILREHKAPGGLARAYRSPPEHCSHYLGQAARTGGGLRLIGSAEQYASGVWHRLLVRPDVINAETSSVVALAERERLPTIFPYLRGRVMAD